MDERGFSLSIKDVADLLQHQYAILTGKYSYITPQPPVSSKEFKAFKKSVCNLKCIVSIFLCIMRL